MDVFAAYVWKEWRDQRSTLGWLAVGLLFLALAAVLWLPDDAVRDPFIVFTIGIGAGMLGFLFTVGSDLLPGELVRRRVRFLERMPFCLRRAFTAKLAFFIGALAASALFGAMLGAAVILLRPEESTTRVFDGDYLPYMAIGAALCAWTFTVSAWVPRGTLALPAGVLVVGLFSWPLWFFLSDAPWYTPSNGEIYAYVALSLVAAPLAAWVSYVHGYRYGRSQGRAAAGGLVVAVLLLLPAWGWTQARVWYPATIDPLADDFVIQHGLVGKSGRFAFVNTQRYLSDHSRRKQDQLPQHALVVDLATGTWRSEGLGEWGTAAAGSTRGCWSTWGLPFAWLSSIDPSSPVVAFNSASGQRHRGPLPLRTCPIGPSPAELGFTDERIRLRGAGLGHAVHEKPARPNQRLVRTGYYDPFRAKLYPAAEGTGDDSPRAWRKVLIRPGRWLVEGDRPGTWDLLDPDSEERTPVVGLAPRERIHDMASDGRVLIRSEGRMVILNPEDGTREVVAFADGRAREVNGFSRIDERHAPVPLYQLYTESGVGVGRLALETSTLHAFVAGSPTVELCYLAYVDEDTILAIEDRRRVVRLSLDGGSPEVLFPRGEE